MSNLLGRLWKVMVLFCFKVFCYHFYETLGNVRSSLIPPVGFSFLFVNTSDNILRLLWAFCLI